MQLLLLLLLLLVNGILPKLSKLKSDDLLNDMMCYLQIYVYIR